MRERFTTSCTSVDAFGEDEEVVHWGEGLKLTGFWTGCVEELERKRNRLEWLF